MQLDPPINGTQIQIPGAKPYVGWTFRLPFILSWEVLSGYSDGFPAHSISGSNKIGLWRIKDHFIPPSYLVIYLVS